jgi:hypothetical protein
MLCKGGKCDSCMQLRLHTWCWLSKNWSLVSCWLVRSTLPMRSSATVHCAPLLKHVLLPYMEHACHPIGVCRPTYSDDQMLEVQSCSACWVFIAFTHECKVVLLDACCTFTNTCHVYNTIVHCMLSTADNSLWASIIRAKVVCSHTYST